MFVNGEDCSLTTADKTAGNRKYFHSFSTSAQTKIEVGPITPPHVYLQDYVLGWRELFGTMFIFKIMFQDGEDYGEPC